MKREKQIVDLGKASIETKGAGFLIADVVGKQNSPGLSND